MVVVQGGMTVVVVVVVEQSGCCPEGGDRWLARMEVHEVMGVHGHAHESMSGLVNTECTGEKP